MHKFYRIISILAVVMLACSLVVVPAVAEYTVQAPEGYEAGGTLPVYKAVEINFLPVVQPEWFNRTGIAEKQDKNFFTFNDHARLYFYEDSISYTEYTGEEYDQNQWLRENGEPDIEPDMFPENALSAEIARLGKYAFNGRYECFQGICLEHDQLSLLSLADARQTAEELLDHLGINGYECAYALDMNLERVQGLGKALNELQEGSRPVNYAAATVEDEGYYLYYAPLGIPHRGSAESNIPWVRLFINSHGIADASISCQYSMEEAVNTPARLLTPEEAVNRFNEELEGLPREKASVKSINQVNLTYIPLRAENKKDGMVFAPVWNILYTRSNGTSNFWADFNAVNGTLIDAFFR